MGLTSSLQIGRSALTASQVAIQVTGNNFANATTPGYSRQTISFSPSRDARAGEFFLGRGVQVQGIRRQIDSAIQARLWAGISEQSSANIDLQLLSQIESTLNELSDNDLSSEFSRFFDAWSQLANSPNQQGARSLVINQGRTLAASMRALRSDLTAIRAQIDRQLASSTSAANDLLGRIADINTAIVQAEAGTSVSNTLRDQRDQLVSELSALVDVTTVEQANGVLDVLVGSIPVVLAGQNRGIELRTTTIGNDLSVSVNLRQDGTQLDVRSGTVGALLRQRTDNVDGTVESLDRIASQLIFQVNRVHSAGYPGKPLNTVTGTLPIALADQSIALNDPNNLSLNGLPFAPVNGGFLVTVRNQSTGATETVRINIDLDGIDNAGNPGTGDDTSLADIVAQLNAVGSVSASVGSDGRLRIDADSGFAFEFSEDSSGVLAVLGVNTYFTGTSARDIDVRQALIDSPEFLVVGALNGQDMVDNAAALAILALRDATNAALGGRSISGAWIDTAQQVGSNAAAATNRASATTLVRENLEAQRSAVSGVSLDEESINLLAFQQQYQGAARFINAVNQLTQELLSIV